jgi:FMN reductase
MPSAASTPSLVAVLGSVTPPGRLHRAVAAALQRAADRHDVAVDVVDLAEVRIAFADGTPPERLDDDTAAVIDRIAAADAILLATPVYRGSLTGALKNLLDHVPVAALRDMPVAVASMGASDHHFLGADRHLRDILSFFGALVAPNAAYLTSRDFEDGRPTASAGARLDALVDAALLLATRAGGAAFGPPPLAGGKA